MPVLMCTQRLWRAIGGKGPLPKLEPTPPTADARLGDWSATLIETTAEPYVIAVNERTYMVAVLPFVHMDRLPVQLGLAAEWQLLQFGVSPDKALLEFRALVDLRYGANRNRSLQGSVNDLGRLLVAYEEEGVEALQPLQLELNDVPHAKRTPCFAEDSVALLFHDDIQ